MAIGPTTWPAVSIQCSVGAGIFRKKPTKPSRQVGSNLGEKSKREKGLRRLDKLDGVYYYFRGCSRIPRPQAVLGTGVEDRHGRLPRTTRFGFVGARGASFPFSLHEDFLMFRGTTLLPNPHSETVETPWWDRPYPSAASPVPHARDDDEEEEEEEEEEDDDDDELDDDFDDEDFDDDLDDEDFDDEDFDDEDDDDEEEEEEEGGE
jgi:hypothetical protein